MDQSTPQNDAPTTAQPLDLHSHSRANAPTNGPAGAAILSSGASCAVLGILAVAGDASKAVAKLLNFYNPSGPLSGVTSLAIVFWLAMWFILAKRWRTKTVAIAKVNVTAFLLLALGILLTFPPFADLIMGK